MNTPRQAPKEIIKLSPKAPKKAKKIPLAVKLKVLRLRCQDLTVEDIAFKVGRSQRQTHRILDGWKNLFKVGCCNALVHAAHAMQVVWACEQEAVDWAKNHSPFRSAQ